MFKSVKKALNRFLESIAKENKKSFGNEKLDCCNLNKPDENKEK